MIKEYFHNIVATIQTLSKKQLEKYIVATLVVAGLLLGGIIFFTYSSSSELVSEMKVLEKQANNAASILNQYKKMQKEEDRIQALLEKHKTFNLKIFFEQFCKENGINPEPGWDTSDESINAKFEEISLPATFKGQTTEKLVQILAKIDKKEILYVKELNIKNDGAKKITFDMTIATKRSK